MTGTGMGLIALVVVLVPMVVLGISRAKRHVESREYELRFEQSEASSMALRLRREYGDFMENTSPYVYRENKISSCIRIEKYGKWPWQKHWVIVISVGVIKRKDLDELRESLTQFLQSFFTSHEGRKFSVKLHYSVLTGPQGVIR